MFPSAETYKGLKRALVRWSGLDGFPCPFHIEESLVLEEDLGKMGEGEGESVRTDWVQF